MTQAHEPGMEPVWSIYPELGTYKVSFTESYQDPRGRTQKNLNEIAKRLSKLEESKANLERQVQEDKEELASLREEVKLFSTFEQICNSGMLRNFKIDPEGDFAQVILGLLQRTMELQINHLAGPQKRQSPRLITKPASELEAS